MNANKEVIDKSEFNAKNHFRELANWCLLNAYKEAEPFSQKAPIPTKINKSQKTIEKSSRNTPLRPFIQLYYDLFKPEPKKLKPNLLPSLVKKKKKRLNKVFGHNSTPTEAINIYNKLNAYSSYRKKKIDQKQLEQATARNRVDRAYVNGKTATLCPGKIIKLNVELGDDKDIDTYLVRQTPYYAIKTKPIINQFKKKIPIQKKLITENPELSQTDIPDKYGNPYKIYYGNETNDNKIDLSKENQYTSDLNKENQYTSDLNKEEQNKNDLNNENHNKSDLNTENKNKIKLEKEESANESLKSRNKLIPIPEKENLKKKKLSSPKEYVIHKKIIPKRKPFPVSFLDVGKSVFPSIENDLKSISVETVLKHSAKIKYDPSLPLEKLVPNHIISPNEIKKLEIKIDSTFNKKVDKINAKHFKLGNKLNISNRDAQVNVKQISLVRSNENFNQRKFNQQLIITKDAHK